MVATIFSLLISLHLSFIIFVISVKLQSCCFLHRNANSILYSSFNSLVQLPTPLLTLLPFVTLHYRILYISIHRIRYQYFSICPIHLPPLLPLPSSISAYPLAAQFYIPRNFLQNLLCELLNYSCSTLNPHTSVPYIIFDLHTTSYIF